MAVLSKDWVYSQSLDGNFEFESGRDHGRPSLVGVVCYRADHTSGGVLPGMVRLGVTVKPR